MYNELVMSLNTVGFSNVSNHPFEKMSAVPLHPPHALRSR
jgi:hypothetical protein